MAIRVLPPDVAARIAAGEVIERPASAAKELVENAIDAGASRIAVEVTQGGLGFIRVTDDGCGIPAEELETAFARHATSKLENDTDLARVLTLGFRGEALPSIAAVAEIEMVSRPPGTEAGAFIRLGPERPTELGVRGVPLGTSVTIRGLFEKLPARRKFLRSPSAEANAIAAVVTHYALAYPEIRFSLTLDGRRSLQTPGSGDLRDAVSAVYGVDLAAAMLPVRGGSGEVMVTGLAAPPQASRSSRAYISIFVNRRWVQNRRLTVAAEGAYEGMLMVGRHPIVVLDVRLPHEEVDVNVHPTKAEVRFRDEGSVFTAVQRAVRAALVEAAPVPHVVSAGGRPALVLESQPGTSSLWQSAMRPAGRAALRARAAVGPEGADAAVTPADALPVLRVIGQFGAIYIVAEGPDGIYLIDQHAAHERVLYEKFWQDRQRRQPEVQGLLEPLALDLSPAQRVAFDQEAGALREHGFEVEPFGDGAYILRAVPRALDGGDVRRAVMEFFDHLTDEVEGDRRDRVAMSLACHAAVRAGKTLSMEEMRDLVRQLEQTETPHTCPHGRPTMVHMSAEALAREFGRR